jgi:prephenate dehydrogenase
MHEYIRRERAVDAAGAPVDLTGYEVRSTVRQGSQVPVIQKSSGDGGVTVVAAEGKVTVHLSATDTLLAEGQYVYDVWAVKASPLKRMVLVPPSDFVVESTPTRFT